MKQPYVSEARSGSRGGKAEQSVRGGQQQQQQGLIGWLVGWLVGTLRSALMAS
jgi:hypothetical protein